MNPQTKDDDHTRLTENHLQDLRRSGLSDDLIREAGIVSLSDNELATKADAWGIPALQDVTSAYKIPYDADGYDRLRLCPPIKRHGDTMKYAQPAGSAPHLYVPPRIQGLVEDPHAWVLFTEGEKKALAAVQAGLACYGLGGIWAWKQRGDRDAETIIDDFDRVPIRGRRIALVYDSDITPDHPGYPAYQRLAKVLYARGATDVRIVTLPSQPSDAPITSDLGAGSENGDLQCECPVTNGDHAQPRSSEPGDGGGDEAKVGLDDYLVALGFERGAQRLRELIEATPPYETPQVRLDNALEALTQVYDESTYRDAVRALAELAPQGSQYDFAVGRLKDAVRHLTKQGLETDLEAERERQRGRDQPREAERSSAPDPEECLAACQHLADAEDILTPVAETLQRLGLAGERDNALLVYLAFTSRLLDQPVNVFVSGPSGSGKTHLVRTVSQLFPDEALHHLTATSERALIYSDDDLRHRVLIISETGALDHGDGDGQGIGAVVLRSLVWNGEIEYQTTEQGADGRFYTSTIRKEGPIAFGITGVQHPDPELLTRLLRVELRDDPEQTDRILHRIARQFQDGAAADPDLTAFHALQRWLQQTGPHEVTIPYATDLATHYDDTAPRGRRDLSQLLRLIQAHALLHQRNRDHDEQARIVADPADYEAVHAIAGSVFEAAANDGLSRSERELVETVQALDERDGVTVDALANRLAISAEAIHKRLSTPKRKQYLVNKASRGQQGKYRPGNALPNRVGLPHPSLVVPPSGDSDAPRSPETSHADGASTSESPDVQGDQGSQSRDDDALDEAYEALDDHQREGECEKCGRRDVLRGGLCEDCWNEDIDVRD